MTSPAVSAKQHLALADRHVDDATVLDSLQEHVPLDLVEQLLTRIPMIVGTAVRSAHDHDDELRVLEDHLVADRRSQPVSMVLDPLQEVEGG
jgi:hypothetical protein